MGLPASSVLDATCEQQRFETYPPEARLKDNSPTVRVFRTLVELEELREIWTLWCDDPNADLDFYLVSAHCRPDFVRPHVMVVYREGNPDCILVGRLERRRLELKVGYATLFKPGVSQLFFLQGGLFGDLSQENLQLLMRGLRQSLDHGEADCAELSRAIPNSSLHKAVRAEFGPIRRGHFSPIREHRWLELPGSFKEFLQGISRKNRHEIRRHEKRLAYDFSGKAHVHCYRHEDEVKELAQEVEKISAKTYQRVLGVGFRPDVETLEALRIAAHQGKLRGCVLYLDENPCAYFIGKQYKNTFHGNFMGFDPQFGKYSPGLLVLMHSIEECFEPGYTTTRVDLGWGDRHYKKVICNRSRQDGPLYLYAPSLNGLKLNFLRSAASLLDLAGRQLLAKSSVLQKLKKLWQGRLQKSESGALPIP